MMNNSSSVPASGPSGCVCVLCRVPSKRDDRRSTPLGQMPPKPQHTSHYQQQGRPTSSMRRGQHRLVVPPHPSWTNLVVEQYVTPRRPSSLAVFVRCRPAALLRLTPRWGQSSRWERGWGLSYFRYTFNRFYRRGVLYGYAVCACTFVGRIPHRMRSAKRRALGKERRWQEVGKVETVHVNSNVKCYIGGCCVMSGVTGSWGRAWMAALVVTGRVWLSLSLPY
jgi:hypothetical protein